MEVTTTDLSFSSRPECSLAASGAQVDNFIVMSSIKAPSFQDENRSAIDLVAVIDRSGSMDGTMPLVVDTLEFVISQLTAKDRLSLVSYDNEILTNLPLTFMDAKGKQSALAQMKHLVPRGGTDLCGGLVRGLDLVRNRVDPKNDVASVLLLTDGHANEGISDTPGILKKMQADGAIAGSVHTFGFGTSHNEGMLKAIADAASGIYYFLKGKDDIPESFADCLGGLLSVVAQNIEIKLTPLNGAKIEKIHTQFKTEALNSGEYIIRIGDVQTEESRDLLARVSLPSASASEDTVYVHATLTYFNVITGQLGTAEADCRVARAPADTILPSHGNKDVDLQKNRILAAEAIASAKTLADSDLTEARGLLTATIEKLKRSSTAEDPFTQSLVADLEVSLRGMADKASYTSVGRKVMTSYETTHYQQRANVGPTVNSYATSARSARKAAYSAYKMDEDDA